MMLSNRMSVSAAEREQGQVLLSRRRGRGMKEAGGRKRVDHRAGKFEGLNMPG